MDKANARAGNLANLHVLRVSSGAGASSIRIRSDRFKDAVSIPYDYDSRFTGFNRQAAAFLLAMGWKVVGIAEGPGSYDFVITDTWDRLPKYPRKSARRSRK